jgi:hypothetical protein
MLSTGQNPARACERLPIIAIRQLGQSTASPAAAKKMTLQLRRTVCLLGPPQGVCASGRNHFAVAT